MVRSRLGSFVRAAVTLPLAFLAGASATGYADPSPRPVGSASDVETTAPLPAVPQKAITLPASVSGAKIEATDSRVPLTAAASASAQEIPSVALAAYQRTEVIINRADHTCGLPWELVAAIGRVESNHGQFAGSTLTNGGVAQPPIIGLRLDGTHDTSVVNDTDAGQYDGDKQFDRAVGPMQFIPSTWSVVGVDADSDGRRNPQDIDDASLAAGVYLCAGKDDLSRQAGLQSAIYRYNHSQQYVTLVLSIMRGYQDVDFTSTSPTATPADPSSSPDNDGPANDPDTSPGPGSNPGSAEPSLGQSTTHPPGLGSDEQPGLGSETSEPSDPPTSEPTSEPTDPPTSEPTSEPTDPPTSEPTSEPTDPPTSEPTSEPTDPPTSEPTHPPTSEPTHPPTSEPTDAAETEALLVADGAVAICTDRGLVDDSSQTDDDYDTCVATVSDAVATGDGYSADEAAAAMCTSAEQVAGSGEYETCLSSTGELFDALGGWPS